VVEGNSFNERKYVLRPDEIDSPAKFRGYATEHARHLRAQDLYLYRVASFMERKIGLEPPRLPSQEVTDIRTLIPRVPLAQYRQALRELAGTARERGIAMVFLVVHDNPVLTTPLSRARRALERGETEHAIEQFGAAMIASSDFSMLARRHLVAAYEQAGQTEAARQTARVAAVRNFMGTAAITDQDPYQAAMKEVAREFGAVVIDLDPATHGGSTIYYDYAHLNAAGHAEATRLLEPVIRRALASRAG
jgi:hypothetical protein